MFRHRLNTLLTPITMVLALLVVTPGAFGFNPFTLSQELDQKLKEKSFLPTTEYYVASEWLKADSQVKASDFREFLLSLRFQEKKADPLREGEFRQVENDQCLEKIPSLSGVSNCFRFWDFSWGSGAKNEQLLIAVGESNNGFLPILGLFHETRNQTLVTWAVKPVLLAQTVGSQPIMQKVKSLSEMPASCLQAVMAIEDTSFLNHSGVSMTGTLRALFKNVLTGRKAQGGSTITQQLVKNYFLTPERTYKRKLHEMALSVLLESQYSKDQILETYLNIIYMAQSGSYQVIGFPAASEYYFGKPIETLDVHECALLAAVLNGPGLYNPFKNPDKSLSRRNLVLNKMFEQKFITEKQFEISKALALPSRLPALASETSPYFLDSARDQMIQLGIPLENSRILLTVDLQAQAEAQKALQKHLTHLESQNSYVKKQKQTLKKNLEGLVLSTDRSGRILVAVGGRSFRQSQFNRVTKSQRQIGSLVKPFVFLSAIENQNLSPLDFVSDQKIDFKFDGQVWSPVNYDKKFLGEVPLYFALKSSLNAATAKLGMQIGLQRIVDTMKASGVHSEIPLRPSLTLGALELSPLEVLQIYLTLSQMGKSPQPTFIESVFDKSGQILSPAPSAEAVQYVDETSAALTVGMLRQTLISGTASTAGALGLKDLWAGKTGTTSDNKDAWFAGFSSLETTLVWVGYDDNTKTSLTGAGGAVPVWTDYTNWSRKRWSMKDFSWPETVEERDVKKSELEERGFQLEHQTDFKLIFRK